MKEPQNQVSLQNGRPRSITQVDETQTDKMERPVWGPNEGLLFGIHRQRKYHGLGSERWIRT